MKSVRKTRTKNLATSKQREVTSRSALELVEAATVKIGGGRGVAQGVLVAGNFIVTAAHCVQWTATGDMALADDEYIAFALTPTCAKFILKVVAVEPASDIAVLATPDYQTFADDADAFEDWCEATKPVRLCPRGPDPGDSVEARVLTRDGTWVRATAVRSAFAQVDGRVRVEYDEPIAGGTSGGPIVTPDGQLLGVVSYTGEVMDGPCDGMVPLARLALPQWVLERVKNADVQRDSEEA